MMNTEDQLQEMLRREAGRLDTQPGVGSDFGQVRTRAVRIRRHRRQRAAGLVAAAVVVITVPTAVLLNQGGTTTGPSHQPTPSHRPSPTRTTHPTIRSLASIPRGGSTFLTYVEANGTVHSGGVTSQLPGTMDVSTQFLGYRGGWLVNGADNQLREYDDTGRLVASGVFGGMALTDDRTQAAWIMGGKLYQDSLNTMGNGSAQGTPVRASAGVIGYVSQGVALSLASGDVDTLHIAKSDGSTTTVPVGMSSVATSQSADLVGGVVGTVAKGDIGGAVFDLRTHTQLWHNTWMPVRFSDDGTLVAAVPAADNGDPSAIAILDARTGKVIARTPKLSGIYLGRDIAWDQHRLIVPAAAGADDKAALLTLDTSGKLTRASAVTHSSKPGGAYFILAAQP